MDNSIEISELVHTISLLRRTQEYTPAPPSNFHTEHKKLSVLDGIALPMVMGGKSDVVAVTYRQTAANLTIYYSANRPDPNRRDHIKEIADTISNIVPNQSLKTPVTAILLSCLEACSRKIKQRVRKVLKASTELLYWNMHQENLEKFVQSICHPGANYPKLSSFSSLSSKPPIYMGPCSTNTSR